MPRSTFYYEQKKTEFDKRNEEIILEIQAVYEENKGRYGVRRVHHELLNRGFQINHKKVQRLMNKLSLRGIQPREKYHSYKGQIGRVASNLLKRDFRATRPNEKWTTDVTQFNLPFGKCYLSPILDMYNNEIVSYDLSQSPNFVQTTKMLSRAFLSRLDLKGLIFHSDQGWQYQMKQYTANLKARGIIQSMSRKGNCYDNSIMETFFGRMKNEMFYGFEKLYQTFEDFAKAVDDYIDYYNNKRIQKKTTWMSPVAFREASIDCSVV